MIGSNSTALRQHAYSVFTASRRERETQSQAPDSVRRLLVPDSPRLERALPTRLVEAKAPGDRPAGAVHESLTKHAATTERRTLPTPPEAKANESATEPASEPTQEEIRRRAYEIFEARGSTPGNDVADWLRAESELRRERGLA